MSQAVCCCSRSTTDLPTSGSLTGRIRSLKPGILPLPPPIHTKPRSHDSSPGSPSVSAPPPASLRATSISKWPSASLRHCIVTPHVPFYDVSACLLRETPSRNWAVTGGQPDPTLTPTPSVRSLILHHDESLTTTMVIPFSHRFRASFLHCISPLAPGPTIFFMVRCRPSRVLSVQFGSPANGWHGTLPLSPSTRSSPFFVLDSFVVAVLSDR